ncbi:Ribokinase-like protein [Didymella exigua CBS 183.55]|uniref:Ribokinase-like protein n=1 Tax=Didymella exigua CBS 183.55 TaxID=1150837 RepID=A0A6A5S4V9_9PLEO|nr:Ribokinase-like protein [Didymella exigua CBS 183.55]KAF1934388.1 Ribokinase-like protein [Didymella exigua CBS 183.55]
MPRGDRQQRLICVGAVYMDTILSVPHYPEEDTKLRAASLVRRRGGNTANTLEVISQLLLQNMDRKESTYSLELSLLTVLPDPESQDTKTVIRSLPDVRPHLYLYRQGQPVAASSYIIQSVANLSRTIVSANPLAEMTVEEFRRGIAPLVDDPAIGANDVWIHFEGRVPEVLLPCVMWLRHTYGYAGKVKISVECEKPDRVGLKEVAALADMVFYSKIWAEAHYENSLCLCDQPDPAETFLRTQLFCTHPRAILVCTWGVGTTAVLVKGTNQAPLTAKQPAWRPLRNYDDPANDPRPVDSVGAGDTFVAGMLYGAMAQAGWTTDERLMFASELAGRKVHQEGFAGLGDRMRESLVWGEKLKVVSTQSSPD